MFELKIYGSSKGISTILSHERGLEYDEICKQLEDKALAKGTYYIEQNGRLVSEKHVGLLEGRATLFPRILGGKGGFGSMLRAIGAQIEKTTNREACRDLSGRRLRDINEEKRLKAWIEKQESREEEEVARKKRKLEKLCAVPKHEFSDKKYEEERSALTDRVGDAVEEGIKMAAAAAEAEEVEKREKLVAKRVGRKTILDDEFNSDELDSSDDSDDSDDCGRSKKIITEKKTSSECSSSSDESRSIAAGSSKSSDDNSQPSIPEAPPINENITKSSTKQLTA
ncbi:replication stress response regulator SDE2 [Venturia canescens]|uniref:replication stress response regulator SDE2 n=1 Tax=Venturia canescens TaxID=32260 RepID=UPI001C9BCD7A|nr:replication stress response regulator SDE2 [Venturia canescens]